MLNGLLHFSTKYRDLDFGGKHIKGSFGAVLFSALNENGVDIEKIKIENISRFVDRIYFDGDVLMDIDFDKKMWNASMIVDRFNMKKYKKVWHK